MTTAAIIAAFVVILFISNILLSKRRGREEGPQARYYTPDALKNAHMANSRRIQAEADYLFYCNRINDLNTMLTEAETAEEEARRKLEKITSLNQSGAVISDKATEKARRELYQQQRRRLSLENQLHAATRSKNKAHSILTE